jgi:hypothetical protein
VAIVMIQPTIVGTRALLMSNTTSMNRHHPLTKQWKAIVAKRKKTDEEMDEVEHLQWMMSVYFNAKLGPVLPTANILAATIGGARLFREGKLVERFVNFVEGDVALEYDGPRDLEKMWQSGHFTDASPTRRGVVAVRPIFQSWAATFSVQLDTAGLDERDFLRHLVKGGSVVGVGSWRKRYGRYRAELNGREVLADGSLGDKFQDV